MVSIDESDSPPPSPPSDETWVSEAAGHMACPETDQTIPTYQNLDLGIPGEREMMCTTWGVSGESYHYFCNNETFTCDLHSATHIGEY